MDTSLTSDEIKRQRMLENLFHDMKDIIPYMEDELVTDISVEDSGEIIVSRFGSGREFTGRKMSAFVAERIIKGTSAIIGRSLNSYTGFPILEGMIPKYNARITGLLPPNTIRPEIQIRMPPRKVFKLEDYVCNEIMTQQQYDSITDAIKNRLNIFVSGTTGCGKTTLTSAILLKMNEFTPDDNFYIVEDVPELQCTAKMKSMIWISKEFASKAVETAMRWSPDRIIFGEVRTLEVLLELLDSWLTHSGNVATFHATSGEQTLLRLRSMLGTKYAGIADHLSDYFQLVIHLKRTKDGIRCDELYRVTEDTDSFLADIFQNNLDR